MANREQAQVLKDNFDISYVRAQLDALVALVNELKADLNSLRTDFRGHDHGATYTAASWRIHNAAGVAASSGSETNTATTSTDVKKFYVKEN